MWKYIGIVFLLVFGTGVLIPEDRIIPVKGASSYDWNKDTFWYEPWGTSGVHKGMDIFAPENTPVIATTNILPFYKGSISKGGKVVVAIGPKWRIHYFAHLSTLENNTGVLLLKGEQLGKVGDTGNAKGKQPHLHYSIISLIPNPWEIDKSSQGYKKAFYVNPVKYLQ